MFLSHILSERKIIMEKKSNKTITFLFKNIDNYKRNIALKPMNVLEQLHYSISDKKSDIIKKGHIDLEDSVQAVNSFLNLAKKYEIKNSADLLDQLKSSIKNYILYKSTIDGIPLSEYKEFFKYFNEFNLVRYTHECKFKYRKTGKEDYLFIIDLIKERYRKCPSDVLSKIWNMTKLSDNVMGKLLEEFIKETKDEKFIVTYIRNAYYSHNFYEYVIENIDLIKTKESSDKLSFYLKYLQNKKTENELSEILVEKLEEKFGKCDPIKIELAINGNNFKKFILSEEFYEGEDYNNDIKAIHEFLNSNPADAIKVLMIFLKIKPETDSFRALFYHFFYSKRFRACPISFPIRFEGDMFKRFLEIMENDNIPYNMFKENFQGTFKENFNKRFFNYLVKNATAEDYPKTKRKISKILMENEL